MQTPILQTERLRLFAHTPEQLRTLLEGTEPYERRFGIRLADGVRDFLVSDEASPDWLARIKTATDPDPWTYGFAVEHQADKVLIGMGGFKGPPDAEGVVEIAYGIVEGYQGRGYATEVARALMSYAAGSGRANTIRAHTLPEANASTRVLEKCGFQCIGEVIDPEDGPVWRWECLSSGPGP
jgi:[ribosomal protein S5]-alanine N-acetyltransferase